jgi:hypothetical protein
MNSKVITYGLLAFFAVIGWNILLIQRDKRMFDAYDKANAIERLKNPPSNSLKTWCERQQGSHPDCNLK